MVSRQNVLLTKWYGQNSMDKMAQTNWYGKIGTDKKVRTKCYADGMSLDIMISEQKVQWRIWGDFWGWGFLGDFGLWGILGPWAITSFSKKIFFVTIGKKGIKWFVPPPFV